MTSRSRSRSRSRSMDFGVYGRGVKPVPKFRASQGILRRSESSSYSSEHSAEEQILLNFKHIDDTFVLTVLANDTINVVKAKIHNIKGIPPDQQILTYIGEKLEDDRSVSDYLLDNFDTVCLSISMQVLFRGITGETITLDLKDSDTINDITIKISDIVGHHAHQIKLVFGEQVLELGGYTLWDYNVQNNSEITVVKTTTWQLWVRLWGETDYHCYDVEGSYTIEDVKTMIQDKQGIHTDQQRLYLPLWVNGRQIVPGQVLRSDQTLDSQGLNVSNYEVILLLDD
jgi:hypothetical protein